MKVIEYKDGTWGAKRKGLFGWKYLNEIYAGNWDSYHAWTYALPTSSLVKFRTKLDCINALSKLFHGKRKLREVLK